MPDQTPPEPAAMVDELTDLLRGRRAIDAALARLVERAPDAQHIGAHVGAAILNVDLGANVYAGTYAGRFQNGSLAGKTVHLAYITHGSNFFDLVPSWEPEDHPDYYLALAGPAEQRPSRRSREHQEPIRVAPPWVILAIYLFDTARLLKDFTKPPQQTPSIATWLRRGLWESSIVWPHNNRRVLVLDDRQQELLALFGDPQS